MTSLNRAFAGRVIFDHLPKTAGQAINAWLKEGLGPGGITPNLIGEHRGLIRQYGGLYSIISAHVDFQGGQGFDPRYQYITLFRNPVDRVVSLLYFMINNHDESQLPELIPLVRRFLDSEGLDLSDGLIGYISNTYVTHFCRIMGNDTESDDKNLANALAAIQQYHAVGIYEDMPKFLAEVAALVGLPPPQEIGRVNITSQRPKVDQISSTFRERIMGLNHLDMRLYADVVAWKGLCAKTDGNPSSIVPKCQKYESVRKPIITTPEVTILTAVLREGLDIRHGQLMTFDVDFILAREVPDLEIGIHILDSGRRRAFGINSTLLGQSYHSLPGGSYRVTIYLVASLPAAEYTAGFSFAERLPENGQLELAWHDVTCTFRVYHQASKAFEGYSYLPAEISLCPTDDHEEVPIIETGV